MKLNEISNTPEREFAIKWMNDWGFNGSFTVEDDGTINVPNSSFDLTNKMIGEDGKLPVKFGKIGRHFDARNCTSLTTLEGFPTEVKGSVTISGAKLKNMMGIPRHVGITLDIEDCEVRSFVGISDMIDFIGNRLFYNTLSIEEGGIGMLLIKGVKVCDGTPF